MKRIQVIAVLVGLAAMLAISSPAHARLYMMMHGSNVYPGVATPMPPMAAAPMAPMMAAPMPDRMPTPMAGGFVRPHVGVNVYPAVSTPMPHPDGPNLYQYVRSNPIIGLDPTGLLTVHVWNYQGKDVAWGHASLTLEDGTHISWWPSADRKYPFGEDFPLYEATPNNPQTYADDVRMEGGSPDWQLEIKCLDEDKIKKWWLAYKGSHKWKTLSNNCSTIVYKALHEGGGPGQFELIWRPDIIKEYAPKAKKKAGG